MTTAGEVQLLNNIRKTTEMGQYGINAVLDYAADPELYTALKQQYREYDKICDAADRLLKARGVAGTHVGMMAKISSEITAAMNLMMSPTVSKIAEMMVKGNTTGITKNLKNLHQYNGVSEEIKTLAEKLISTEQGNIEQMKKFL